MSAGSTNCRHCRRADDIFMGTRSSQSVDRAPPSEPAFNVAVVYDEFVAGWHAVETCNRLISELKNRVSPCVRMWSFDLLRNGAVNAAAASDTAKAQMVVVATSSAD